MNKILAFWGAHIFDINNVLMAMAGIILAFCLIWLLVHIIEFDD